MPYAVGMTDSTSIDVRTLVRDERRLMETSPHGGIRIGIGYPNRYHVALSSLAHQWIAGLASRVPDVGVDRFYADPSFEGRTFLHGIPLGDLDVLAFTCSFEPDAAHLLEILDRAGIPRRSTERGPRRPLVVVGGPVASINPLPLSPAVDVFCLGAGEILLPHLLRVLTEAPTRRRALEELASFDGFFVPRYHLDEKGRPMERRRRLEKRDRHMAAPDLVPVSHIVTPHTEYSGRGLIEMSRGCPEKCAYCWVGFNYGRLRIYPADAILDRVDRLSKVTRRIGFVATAVGDHPDLPAILQRCLERDLDVALSSLRIPAMVPDVLRPLARSGARSVTIAPETGSEELRRRLNKPISNDRILEAVEYAQEAGIPGLKMYFIVGLPGETDDDVEAIGALLRSTREIMLAHGRRRGHVGPLHAGVSILIPKPYTPYSGVAMLEAGEARRRLRLLRKSIAGLPNFRLNTPSYREAVWQGYLGRGGVEAFSALQMRADGRPVAEILASRRSPVEAATVDPPGDDRPWEFIGSAPIRSSRSERFSPRP